jgi:hypothetical protein
MKLLLLNEPSWAACAPGMALRALKKAASAAQDPTDTGPQLEPPAQIEESRSASATGSRGMLGRLLAYQRPSPGLFTSIWRVAGSRLYKAVDCGVALCGGCRTGAKAAVLVTCEAKRSPRLSALLV